MAPLIEQIKEAFPEMEQADIFRVMSWLGYSYDDIYNLCAYQEIKGQTYFVQSALVEYELAQRLPFTCSPSGGIGEQKSPTP